MFTLTAHFGFVVKGNPHLDKFLKLFAIIQMIGYSIQFEYVSQNGTVRPYIEVPLMDNKLTAKQLLYCVDEMLRTVAAVPRVFAWAVIITIYSGAVYFWKNRSILNG